MLAPVQVCVFVMVGLLFGECGSSVQVRVMGVFKRNETGGSTTWKIPRDATKLATESVGQVRVRSSQRHQITLRCIEYQTKGPQSTFTSFYWHIPTDTSELGAKMK